MGSKKSNKITHRREANAKRKLEINSGLSTNQTNPEIYCTPIPVCTTVKPNLWKVNIKRIYKWTGKFIGYIIIASALLVANDQFHDWRTSKEKLWREKTYVEGVVIPLDNIDYNKGISIILGGSKNDPNGGVAEVFSISALNDTVQYQPTAISLEPSKNTIFGLKFLLKENRLYVSATLKDIDGKYVGKIDITQMELRTSKISNYHTGKDNLEIIDDYGNVLFNMTFMYPNNILINGYYISDNHIIAAANSGIQFFSIDSERQAINVIQKIPKLNNY